MDIQNEFEQELVFQVKSEKNKTNKTNKSKKIEKIASENIRKILEYKLQNKSGEC